MFELLFKYPRTAFAKGHIVLLGPWPTWALWLLIAAAALTLAWLIRVRLSTAVAGLRTWRIAVIWLLQSALVAVLLLLLWQPAVLITELKPQQDIIAVLVDDSRSMTTVEDGSTRLSRAVKVLEGGMLTALRKKFQIRLYRVDSQLTPIADLKGLRAGTPSTRIADSLRQLAAETSDLPLGAIVLLSDGADNSGGIGLDTISALRSRHIPVHAVGFGRERPAHDVEIDDAALAPRTLAESRLAAVVSLHQHGYAGRKSTLTVRDGARVLASREVTFRADGNSQSETLVFNAGPAGARALQFAVALQPGEENTANNQVTRLINVESDKRRVLYIEGEPRWEYKFIRRAEEDDAMVQVVSMLRTTENKIYRQGLQNPADLADGFPSRPEDLFAYQALIIGSVDAKYFTPAQQELIRQFVDRRGGGLLVLAGRSSLADGGWGASNLADLLPVVLPDAKDTYHVDPATVELTPAGADNFITRLTDDPASNAERWKKLPYLIDFQDPGTPKPGAVVLAEMTGNGRRMPFLITENYGAGRTAVLASAGTWRWQMNLRSGDTMHAAFWQQLIRWLVINSAGRVAASVPNQVLFDNGHVVLSAEVRGKDYQPVPDARVEAHIIGPGGVSASLDMTPVPDAPGAFQAEWTAAQAGLVPHGGDRAARRRTDRPRRPDVSAHGRRGGELSHEPEPRPAGPPRVADRRPLLAARGRRDAARRDRVFRSRRHDARDARAVEHAGGVSPAPADPIRGVAAAAQVGDRVRTSLGVALLCLLLPMSARADTYFVTVAGLPGDADYEQRYTNAAAELDKLLKASGTGVHVYTLTGADATRARLTEVMGQVARAAKSDDDFVLTLVGHGSYDGVEYKFNLVGPDISAAELARLCNAVASKRQLVVDTTSSSGGAIPLFQRKGRGVIAATKSGTEKNATVFVRYWVQAFQDPAADVDKNESVSALEAFQYAERKTTDFYSAQKRLATEHPVFEDVGKGEPVRVDEIGQGEGRFLASFTLIRLGGARSAALDPAKRDLLARKESLEGQIDILKYQKAATPVEEYQRKLRALLLDLARVQAELDK